MAAGPAWSILPCSENWRSTVDGGEVTTAGALSGGIASGTPRASGGGCETRLSCDAGGCVEVLSAARGRALVTGRNTVPPFSMCCVGYFVKENYELERLTNTRAHDWMVRSYGLDQRVPQTGSNRHLMIRSQALKLPVGDVPDWEVAGGDSDPSDLKSPAERQVVNHKSVCDPA